MKIGIFVSALISVLIILSGCSPSRKSQSRMDPQTGEVIKNGKEISEPDTFISSLLAGYPHYFDSLLKNKDSFGIQIIYTQIDRGRNGNARFTDYISTRHPR